MGLSSSAPTPKESQNLDPSAQSSADILHEDDIKMEIDPIEERRKREENVITQQPTRSRDDACWGRNDNDCCIDMVATWCSPHNHFIIGDSSCCDCLDGQDCDCGCEDCDCGCKDCDCDCGDCDCNCGDCNCDCGSCDCNCDF